MAHKKGQGTSRNGRDSNAQRLGFKAFGGQLVPGGTIIVRQRGTRVKPGLNVGRGKDDTLFAKISGRIKFMDRGGMGKFVMIEPVEVTSEWPRQVYNPEDFMSFRTGPNGPISDHGDSGSIWVSAETDYYPRCAVALLFKGDKKFSYALDIRPIMTKLDFSFTDSLEILD